MSVQRTPLPVEFDCAGHQCPARENCVRWMRNHAQSRPWASFDIERIHFGTCDAQIKPRGPSIFKG